MPAGAPRRGESSESIIRGALAPATPAGAAVHFMFGHKASALLKGCKITLFIFHSSLFIKKGFTYKQTRAHGDVHRLRGGGTFKMRAIMLGSARC